MCIFFMLSWLCFCGFIKPKKDHGSKYTKLGRHSLHLFKLSLQQIDLNKRMVESQRAGSQSFISLTICMLKPLGEISLWLMWSVKKHGIWLFPNGYLSVHLQFLFRVLSLLPPDCTLSWGCDIALTFHSSQLYVQRNVSGSIL